MKKKIEALITGEPLEEFPPRISKIWLISDDEPDRRILLGQYPKPIKKQDDDK